jgi:hypothetical protein
VSTTVIVGPHAGPDAATVRSERKLDAAVENKFHILKCWAAATGPLTYILRLIRCLHALVQLKACCKFVVPALLFAANSKSVHLSLTM